MSLAATKQEDHHPELPAASKRKWKLPELFDHFNARDLKAVLRCSVALWVTSLMLIDQTTLNAMGTSAFFGIIVVYLVPPNGVIMLFIMQVVMVLIGLCIVWAWGVIAMKAAQAARPAALLHRLEVELGQLKRTNPAAAAVAVQEGWFLHTSTSVIFLVFELIALYILARLRMKNMKFILPSIICSIACDVFITLGPLIPTFDGTILQVFLKPGCTALAVGLACSILIFPESTSAQALATTQKLLKVMTGAVGASLGSLSAATDKEANIGQLEGLRQGLLANWRAMQPIFSFLPLDISYGLWGAEDVLSLKQPLQKVLLVTLSLLDFEIERAKYLAEHRNTPMSTQLNPEQSEVSTPEVEVQHKILDSEKEHVAESPPPETQRGQVIQALAGLDTHNPALKQSSLQVREALKGSSSGLLHTCLQALQTSSHLFALTNKHRLFSFGSKENPALVAEHEAVLAQLQALSARYPAQATDAIFHATNHLFNVDGRIISSPETSASLLGFMYGLRYEDLLLHLVRAMEDLLCHATALERRRTKPRFWFPTKLERFFTWMQDSHTPGSHANGTEVTQPDKATIREFHNRLHIPVAHTKKRRNALTRAILWVMADIKSDSGKFAFRIVLATLVGAIIGLNKHSVAFFQKEHGMWLIIVSQTCMEAYMANAIGHFILRMGGILAGGLLALGIWYIGDGRGSGNPYGLAVAMIPASVLLVWGRLFLPMKFFFSTLLYGVTFAVVLGFSWLETHNPTYGIPHYGYGVFWHRLVLVFCGFLLSLICGLIPWPTSQARSVANMLATIFHVTIDHYSVLLQTWSELPTSPTSSSSTPTTLPSAHHQAALITTAALRVTETLAGMFPLIAGLKWEFSSSNFDTATCMKLKSLIERTNIELTRLHLTATHLPPHLRRRFNTATGFLADDVVDDVMAVLHIIKSALQTGAPLPSRMPSALAKRCVQRDRVAALDGVTAAELRREEYREFCAGVAAYLAFLRACDEMVVVLKKALGEAHAMPRSLQMGDVAGIGEVENMEVQAEV